MKRPLLVAGFLSAIITVVALGTSFAVVQPDDASAPMTIGLTPIAIGFNNPIGIDHHEEPTPRVVMSVNYPTGLPYNFELVAQDGTRTQFSSISGLTEEVKIAAVRSSSCQAGFTPGELFTGTGIPGQIARISPDGSSAQIPWVTLPGETGLLRGSLFQDRFCSFGGDLIVVTTAGNAWRVTSAGVPSLLVSLGPHLEGLTTVPNDPVQYGPWAGKILAGAEGQGCVYSIDAQGSAQCWQLGINPEDIDIIPPVQNFFGVDFGGATLWGADFSQFTSMVGDVLIAQESPGNLWQVHWDAGSGAFQTTLLAQVPQWEHVTFSSAGILAITPPPSPTPTEPPTPTPTPTPASILNGRMNGGGSVIDTSGVRASHGFELHCNPSNGPNNLEVNWMGNRFHLESLATVVCSDDPTIAPDPPAAPFDTYHGTGTGRYNGASGATIEFTFTDAGEPGKYDWAQIVIWDAGGSVVLSVSGNLRSGNHQALEEEVTYNW